MSTTVQVKPGRFSSSESLSIEHITNFARPRGADEGSVIDSDDSDTTPTINDVESLKKGIIKTSKNDAGTPYTILLVGETGVGKSSVLELIANVLIGNVDHYDFDILDHTNEQGGSNNQSQTNSARLYKITSSNGKMVRILDTPGLADTRGVQQDELHKRSIATQIKEHVDSVTAVLVLANGTVPRVTVGTDYALSTLSTIFPKSLASNIAFMFTNVSSPLHWNFSGDTIPEVLKDAPRLILNNPIALHKKYLKLKGDPSMKKGMSELLRAVKAGEQNALEMLVDLFDWLDGLEPQPTREIFPLYEEPQNIVDTLAPSVQNSVIIHAPTSKQKLATDRNHLCTVPKCHFTCSTQLPAVCVMARGLIPWIQLVLCSRCKHPYLFHVHAARLRSQRDLRRVTDNATDEISPLGEDYAGAWPSWSLSARVAKAIRLLEQRHADMEEKGVSQEQLAIMQRSLEQMRRRLDLLRNVKEKAQKGIRKIFLHA